MLVNSFDCIIHSNLLSNLLKEKKNNTKVLLTQNNQTFSYIAKLHDHIARKRDIGTQKMDEIKQIYRLKYTNIFQFTSDMLFFFVHFHHIFAVSLHSFFIQSKKWMKSWNWDGGREKRAEKKKKDEKVKKRKEDREQQERRTEFLKLEAEEWNEKSGSKKMKWEGAFESKTKSEKKTFKENEMHAEASERLNFPISLLQHV